MGVGEEAFAALAGVGVAFVGVGAALVGVGALAGCLAFEAEAFWVAGVSREIQGGGGEPFAVARATINAVINRTARSLEKEEARMLIAPVQEELIGHARFARKRTRRDASLSTPHLSRVLIL